MRTRLPAALSLGLLAALPSCATKGQVVLLEGEIQTMRIETARRDSVRAAALAAVLTLQQRILDSVAAGREALSALDVRLQSDLTDVQRQLLQVQELTGQSQRRITEIKVGMETRAEQSDAVRQGRPAADSSHPPAAAGVTVAPDQIFQSARQQQLRGALGTARMGYQEFLKTYPTHPLVSESLFYIGESFASDTPDSAVAYYTQVVARFPQAPKAGTALYRMGHIEEARHNTVAARNYYERLIREYPRSEDVDLARDHLKTLRP